jgi:hypothetical protein
MNTKKAGLSARIYASGQAIVGEVKLFSGVLLMDS